MRRNPIRTCVACRESGDKRTLVRFVRTPDGQVVLDPTGKQSGRGAYVCATQECLDKALKGPLEKALKVKLDPVSKEGLISAFAKREDKDRTKGVRICWAGSPSRNFAKRG